MHTATRKKLFPLRVCVSSLSGKDIELPNKAVKRSLSGQRLEACHMITSRQVYSTYTPKERALIGKYAADNGATKAATHFSKLLDSKIGESNVSILDLRDKRLYMFSSVARCAPRITSYANINCQNYEDHVIAFAVQAYTCTIAKFKFHQYLIFEVFGNFANLILANFSGYMVSGYYHTCLCSNIGCAWGNEQLELWNMLLCQ